MRIEKVVVENFLTYYGRNELKLSRGVNLILGEAGAGKTSLWKAIFFAVSGRGVGRFDSLASLINNRHKEETSTPSCRAKVEFTHEGKRLPASCSLKVDAGEIFQTRRESLTIDKFEIPYTSILVDAEMTDQLYQEHKEDWSTGKRWAHLIMKDLARNSQIGIKTAILDGAFEYLSPDYREKVLTFADELPMEQLIIMVKQLPDNVQNRPCTIHRIEYDPLNGSSRIVERKEAPVG